MAAIPIARPFNPSIAVKAIELNGEVQIIFIIPPSKKPITKGDCSAATEIIPPILSKVEFTNGSTPNAIILASGAKTNAPKITFKPSGNFFSIIGAINPTRYPAMNRSEEHTSELQSRQYLVCRLLLEKKK